ncbi:MAG: hypothetical protein QF473_02655, partial [Planctomycetota bacterium]|nr:hypothetical protein [Planctomycetota bacterium]
IGHAIELSPRRAVFQKALRQKLSPQEAALAFRRSTVDFQRIGQSMRLGITRDRGIVVLLPINKRRSLQVTDAVPRAEGFTPAS